MTAPRSVSWYATKRWQDAINKVSLNLKGRRRSSSTNRGSLISDSDDTQDGPRQPPVNYENTYKLEPDTFFPTKKAEDIIKSVFTNNLENTAYNTDTGKQLSTHLSDLIRTQVKQELGLKNRYKIVVLVTMGSKEGQGIRCASRCLWYPQFDRFASYSFYNEHVFAVGTVYGVYFE